MQRHTRYQVKCPVRLILDTTLTGNEFRYLVYLRYRQGKNNHSWPSIRRIAKDLGLGERTIDRLNTRLRRAGYLQVTQKPSSQGKKNLYSVAEMFAAKMTAKAASKWRYNYIYKETAARAFGLDNKPGTLATPAPADGRAVSPGDQARRDAVAQAERLLATSLPKPAKHRRRDSKPTAANHKPVAQQESEVFYGIA